ncbi:MAG: hypothetical protein ABR508_06220 [Candidatus Baltobacteraceae bacterium]
MHVISARELQRGGDMAHLRQGAPQSVALRIAQIGVRIETAVPGLAAELALRYAGHLDERAPDFVYRIFPSPQGYAFWCDHDGAWQWKAGSLPLDAIAFLADAAMLSALVHFDPLLASVHAAAVAAHGCAAAIAGDSTAGKTTTLLACARAGLQVYSDERALVRQGIVHSFLRRCSVRPDGRSRLLADDDADALAHAMHARGDIALAAVFGEAAVAPPLALRALFVLDGYAARPFIEPIDATAALPAVSRWFDTCGGAIERTARALGLLRSLHCFRLTLGTPRESALAVRETLEQLAWR